MTLPEAYEANCPLKSKHPSTKAPWWNKKFSKHRSEIRRLFIGIVNRAKRTKIATDGFQELPTPISIIKRNSWTDFCKSIKSALEAFKLSRILSKDNSSHLSCQIPKWKLYRISG